MNDGDAPRKSDVNPVTITLLVLVLLVAVAILCELTVLLHERRSGAGAAVKRVGADVAIPLSGSSEESFDYGSPEIDGRPIAVPAAEAGNLRAESAESAAEFSRGLERLRKNGDDDASLLSKRDEFAGRRLELLKRLEKAKTGEERRKILEELE